MVVVGVGLSGAPQLGVLHPGALVVESFLIPEWEDARLALVGSANSRTTRPGSSRKASCHEEDKWENALGQHDSSDAGI